MPNIWKDFLFLYVSSNPHNCFKFFHIFRTVVCLGVLAKFFNVWGIKNIAGLRFAKGCQYLVWHKDKHKKNHKSSGFLTPSRYPCRSSSIDMLPAQTKGFQVRSKLARSKLWFLKGLDGLVKGHNIKYQRWNILSAKLVNITITQSCYLHVWFTLKWLTNNIPPFSYLHNLFCPVVRFWCMLLRFSNCYVYISISGSFFAWVSNKITTWRNVRFLRLPLRAKCCHRSWKCTIMTTVSRSKEESTITFRT